jgi:hypothetical protein
VAGISAGSWNGAAGAVQGYLGFRFQSPELSPGNHYGFFDVTYTNDPVSRFGNLIISGWEYETTTGAGVLTGPIVAGTIPEPASMALAGLGLLALGAAGLRRKRAQK